ncbi:MAG TPA: response regulator [Rubrobacteraceae bacterium]|nr:response regulator [Rubrobacteraceae bacterium]
MMHSGKILLVEDDPYDVELTLSALAENHLTNEVVVVRDGVEALDYLYRRGAYESRVAGHPVVMLLDLKLPKVDGLEVLERVKSNPNLKTTPVVMLTSSHEGQDLARSYNLGTNAYVVKPVDFTDFVEAIRELGLFWAVVNQPPPGSAGQTH